MLPCTGQEVQLAEAQQGTRPEETARGCPGELYSPAQATAMLLHVVQSRIRRNWAPCSCSKHAKCLASS